MGRSMNFLELGDEPRFAEPLKAWPQYSRVGYEFEADYSSGSSSSNVKPSRDFWHEQLLREDKELLVLLMVAVKTGVIQ